jgi:type 1 glutamine amidotransferase
MKRLIFICAVLLGVIVAAGLLVAADANRKIKVMFLQGGGVHDWKSCTPILKSVLDQTNDFEVTFTENLDDLKEHIKQFDIIIQYTTGMELTKEQENGLCDFIQNGGGYVGIHSASDSFKNSDRYWEMLGGRFAEHGSGKFTVYIYDHSHPITKGMQDFDIEDETYSHNYHRNAQMRSLTRMNRDNERQSMSWVSSYGKGRVFYTGNGHGREAWTNPHFQRLVVRAAYWAAARKVKDPPNIR